MLVYRESPAVAGDSPMQLVAIVEKVDGSMDPVRQIEGVVARGQRDLVASEIHTFHIAPTLRPVWDGAPSPSAAVVPSMITGPEMIGSEVTGWIVCTPVPEGEGDG